jgi:hypothetical protein
LGNTLFTGPAGERIETIMAIANRRARQTNFVKLFVRHGESKQHSGSYRDQFDGETETPEALNESHKAHRRDRRMRKLAYKRDRYN